MTSVRQAVNGPTPNAAPRARTPEKRRPPLRVVRGPELTAHGRRRRARLLSFVLGAVVVAGLFGLAVFNVMLAQGQVRLNEIEARASVEQDRYERLRLEVATLESPERVVAAAQERLGMIPPDSVHYLAPAPAAGSPAPKTAATEVNVASSPVTSDWAQVKPHLAAQR